MKIIKFALLFILPFSLNAQQFQDAKYTVPVSPWKESFGNHRAVLNVPESSGMVYLDICWRRHDNKPEDKRLLIVNSQTGDTIRNIFRFEVNNERCRIAFGPVSKPGIYYFYYLPFEVQENWGGYDKDYLKHENEPSAEWVKATKPEAAVNSKKALTARLLEFQSRTAFDSFYPMEIIPLASEKKILLQKYPDDWLIFPEDRAYPVRMRDEIPLKWIKSGPAVSFSGEACRNEYYAFQLAVYAVKKKVENITVTFTPLKGSGYTIPVSALTCFNTGGTGPYGQPFTKRVDIEKGTVQPLWLGIDLPADIPPGVYSGNAIVSSANSGSRSISISIRVNDKVLADRGDSETWRHSRLRWLNSTLGIDDKPVKLYTPIEFLGNSTYRLTDKTLKIGEKGLPSSVKINDIEILDGEMLFKVETRAGIESFTPPEDIRLLKNEPGNATGAWRSHSPGFTLEGIGVVESDGYINYKVRLKAIKEISVSDIRLELPFRTDAAQYMIGMGLPGTTVPDSHQAKWRGPYDSFWIGGAYAGLWCELRGADYCGPLLNLYHPAPPVSWCNNDKGGFRIVKGKSNTTAVIYSGERTFSAGDSIDFEWSFLITPVKKLNSASQFTDRYYHNGENPLPSDSDLSCGVRIVNLHHANNYNPHINYPFIAVDSMKWFVNRMHAKGQKVKIYYTIRELTNYATEIWALRSLGNEILGDGDGGGFTWLREHFITGYRPQWYQHFSDKSSDASIVSAPGDSRWYNYYIEGLAWLVRNVDIDGLYLDDVTYDRRTVKRIRKVLDNTKPGCLLDLHSNTGFSKGPANQYAEYFPYIDKIWFGESFQYDQMSPANWLVETSGIPFGLMGDMLQGGGNRWLGMVYGMTVRHPWLTEGVTCDPRPVWEIWDRFGIASSVMKGYWDEDSPVKTTEKDILATAYVREKEVLVAVGSWSETTASFRLLVDWKAIGLDHSKSEILAPFIKDFQEMKVFKPDESIPVDSKRGWLLLIHEKTK